MRYNSRKIKVLQYSMLLFIVITSFSVIYADTCNFPFPQNTTYPFGIKPNNFTNAQMNQFCMNWFNLWKAKYLTQNNCTGTEWRIQRTETGNYITNGCAGFATPPAENDTVSEAIGYGMVIMVFMSSATNNTETYFDGLYTYYKDHEDGNGLMNWQIPYCTSGGSATDADEDVAFALIAADKQWGSAGTINYKTEATAIIGRILSNEINSTYDVRPGDGWDAANISYFAPYEYRMFGDYTGTTTWYSVASHTYNTIVDYYSNSSTTYNTALGMYTGLMPNWCNYDGTYNNPGAWSMDPASWWWDAIRHPWRQSYDYLLYGTLNGQHAYDNNVRVSTFFQTKYGGDATQILSHYTLDGTATTYNRGDRTPDLGVEDAMNLPGPEGAVAIAAMVQGDQNWLNECYYVLVTMNAGTGSGQLTETGVDWGTDYFCDILKMQYLLILSGNEPNPLGNYPTPTVTPTNTYGPSPTPTNTPPPGLFDDFETGALRNLVTNPGGGSTVAVTNTNVSPHEGLRDMEVQTTGANGWSLFYIDSPYGGTQDFRDFAGATAISFWINAPAGMSFFIEVVEATANGADGETWSDRSTPITTTGTGWQNIVVNLSTFTRDPYSPVTGNDTFDLQAIKSVGFQFADPGTATIYMDDIWFTGNIPAYTATSTVTITRTRTPMPYSPTPTPIVSATPSATITQTCTISPVVSPTPSNTITLTCTITPTPMATAIRVNCGGPLYYPDSMGNTWNADQAYATGSWGYNSGATANRGSISIGGTNDPTLYQTERDGNPFSYEFTLPNGTYQVTLCFAETYFTASGSTGDRIFSVTAQGVTVVSNLDIYATVGADYAYNVTFTANVTSGTLILNWAASVNNGEINAIQVLPVLPTPTNTPTVTKTSTFTYTATASQTFTGTATGTYTLTKTFTATASQTLSQTPTVTATNTAANTFTVTPTGTKTATGTGTATLTVTAALTFTCTASPSAAASATNTDTQTATKTNTPTWTSTNSPTLSITQTATWTNTPSYTITPTGTATRTDTMTASPTLTDTPSNTATPTCTSSPTATPTNTPVVSATPTYTITMTPTNIILSWTITPTRTITQTFTATPSFSPSYTASPTNTATWTPTNSPSATFTYTLTWTPTSSYTASPTLTSTKTFTYTASPTSTMTFTPSVTQTQSFTLTATGTQTPTPSLTATPTYTGTPTQTITNTVTQTDTPVVSATPTYTITMTPTNIILSWTITPTGTITQTCTATPSFSSTFTLTWTFTPTFTLTNTITATYTYTITSSATNTPVNTLTVTNSQTPVINSPTNTQTMLIAQPTPTATIWQVSTAKGTKVFPNPINPDKIPYLNFCCNFDQDTDKITVKIYTVSYRLIKEYVFYEPQMQQVIAQGYVQCDAGKLNDLSNGTYYYVIITGTQGKTIKKAIGKFIIIK